ncbi:MAG: DUF4384 domain-containing protein [Gemmatimonadota bacterium]
MIALLLPLLAAAAAPGHAPVITQTDPPIRLTVSADGRFVRGDYAKLHVRTDDDGYVIVLRATTEGRVRVLFPLDPSEDAFVRGGKNYEIRGRGDREAFTVDDGEGTGTLYAAVSKDPFRFDEFVRGDHWDYASLNSSNASGTDAEGVLTDLVEKMSEGRHFDYDLVNYSTYSAQDYATSSSSGYGPVYQPYYDPFYDPYYPGCYGCGYGSSISLTFGFGHRRHYGYGIRPIYDPFFYDPYYAGYYQPTVYYGGCYSDPFCYPRRAFYSRPGYTHGVDGYGYGFKPGGSGIGFVGYRPRGSGAPFGSGLESRRRGAFTPVSGRPASSGGSPQVDPRVRAPNVDGTRYNGTPKTGDQPRRRTDPAPATRPDNRPGERVRPDVQPPRTTREPDNSPPRRVEPTQPDRRPPSAVQPGGNAPRVSTDPDRSPPRRVEPAQPDRRDPGMTAPERGQNRPAPQPRAEPQRQDPPRQAPPRQEQPRQEPPRRAEPAPRQAPPPPPANHGGGSGGGGGERRRPSARG